MVFLYIDTMANNKSFSRHYFRIPTINMSSWQDHLSKILFTIAEKNKPLVLMDLECLVFVFLHRRSQLPTSIPRCGFLLKISFFLWKYNIFLHYIYTGLFYLHCYLQGLELLKWKERDFQRDCRKSRTLSHKDSTTNWIDL